MCVEQGAGSWIWKPLTCFFAHGIVKVLRDCNSSPALKNPVDICSTL